MAKVGRRSHSLNAARLSFCLRTNRSASVKLAKMNSPGTYRAFADAVLVLHVGFVSFVVVGLLVILLGGFCGWEWVRNPWFRALHLAAIGLVVVQAWFGVICPLTTLEMDLRERAGDITHHGTFVAHWLQKLLY